MKKRIVTIGGGTGISSLLAGLKKHNCEISAIVSMSDDGGSNKVIRDEFNLLPTSDIRQCLIALSDNKNKSECQKVMRRLFRYRFNRGNGIKGMTFGNLFMAALADILKNQEEAIKKTEHILETRGRIIPVTKSNSRLVALYENGMVVKSEHCIDEPIHDGRLRIKRLYLEPLATANTEAVEVIKKADLIIIGPGDLYTSLVANLVVEGIAEAIKNAKAKIAYFVNIMTSFGETYGFKASDHVNVVENYILGRKLDYVIVNSSVPPRAVLVKYRKANEFVVDDDLESGNLRRVIRADLINTKVIKKDESDMLNRSLIKHDSAKMAKIVMNLIKSSEF